MTIPLDLEYARQLDREDELAVFRQRFAIEDPELVYLDGNSLGRLPLATKDRMRKVVEEAWGQQLVRSWGQGWIHQPESVGGKIAELIGARPEEVIVADSTSVNLFKLVLAALKAQPKRTKIVTDDLNFPSDLYILQGACKLAGRPCHLQVVKSKDGVHGPTMELAKAIDADTALVTLSHTTFKSGYTYDMRSITAMVHGTRALMLWDLSHSAGAMPIQLNEAGVELAVGCTYKYLNGGPGAPAFLYVRNDWQERLENPISGWMGQEDAFNFDLDYRPAPGLRRFLTGTPPILSLTAIESGVDLLLEAGLGRIRAKSIRQSEYLITLWRALLAPLGFTLNSPPEADLRGSHVSLGHKEGFGIDLALIHEMKVLPDFRHPDNIRLGVAPLYTSFADIHTAVMHLRTVVEHRLYEKYIGEAVSVT